MNDTTYAPKVKEGPEMTFAPSLHADRIEVVGLVPAQPPRPPFLPLDSTGRFFALDESVMYNRIA